MTNANDARRAHEVLDGLSAGRILSRENEQLLRSFLPELPKQQTLEEITEHVCAAWTVASGIDWGGNSYDADMSIDDWLWELYEQLKGLTPAKPAAPAHPEFLETEDDYANAPKGTVVACDESTPWHKFDSVWLSTITHGRNDAKSMTGVIRRVLRWGNE